MILIGLQCNGYSFYSSQFFLKEARPITGALMILADVIHLPIEILMVGSFIISIGVMAASVVLLYEIFSAKWQNMSKMKKVMLLLISYVTIFSYLSIEFIIFLETCIMALGLLLSVLACKIVINNEKNKFIKSFLILFIAVFCYQGAIAIFPMILLAYYAIIEPLKLKDYIKLGIKVALIYGIEMFLTVLYVKILIPTGSRIQIGVKGILTAENIFKWLKALVVDSLEVIYPYVDIGVIVFTVLLGLIGKESMKEKLYKIFLYLIVIVASIVICMMPIFVSSGLDLYPRMCTAYGYTIGISLLFIFEKVRKEDRNFRNIFVYIIICIIFALNTVLYIVLTHQHILVNKADKKVGNEVNQIITKYEEETGIRILHSYGVVDLSNRHLYIDDSFIHVSTYTQKALTSWAMPYFFIFCTHNMNYYGNITMDSFKKRFSEASQKQLQEEHVYIEGNTVFFYDD